jgi:biopolymer transport protein ExbD
MRNSFEREELQAPLAEINMTPMVDVMLVLMVIFLVSAPLLSNAINLNLPNENAAQVSNDKAKQISIDSAGRYFFDNHEVGEAELETILSGIGKNHHDEQIHLRADKNVNYGKVSHVLALAQKYGLTNIGFITEPK